MYLRNNADDALGKTLNKDVAYFFLNLTHSNSKYQQVYNNDIVSVRHSLTIDIKFVAFDGNREVRLANNHL